MDTVKGMMDDATLSAYLNTVMFGGIVPLPEAERQDYARTIMERFGNPSSGTS
ncbi:hypothetical protein [Azospirillum formosense]|uniref:hypothetical protein n=1 Tax=Azospirillum formosense TaxID=861533 RepID=UPI00338E8AC0